MTLEILTAPSLSVPHGFFTRKGGASSGVFEGLNCGPGSSDQRQAVAMNRSRVAHAMEVADASLVTIHQTHSPDVVEITAALGASPPPEADGMVSRTEEVVLGILTADCMPVLFADTTAGVIGAAHAGWKGALAGVLERTIDAMENLGADRRQIAAVIGPSISQRAYEVGPDFMDRFLDDDPGNDRFFAGGVGDRVQFDLISYGLTRLRAAGIGAAEWTGHCTYSDPKRFFSYRRSVHEKQADYGRLISTIRL
ncbi:peptidoglycan editing factor PgeF [Tropicimonas sp. S265A]|uniref:peptidoglycan editing factor PgeF n=1 Tax=Tropicimonas sp. S265A TaxID=3415134 RepID=UPI003C7CB340